MSETMNFRIDPHKCVKCGKCIFLCKNRAIEFDRETKMPHVAGVDGASRCSHCHHCLMVCPTGALSIDGQTADDCEEILPGTNFQSLLNLVKSRRSYRDYKQKNVDKEVIDDLLGALRYPPTGCNFRHLHFAMIDDLDVMNAYRDSIYEYLCDRFTSGNVPENLKQFEGLYHGYCGGADLIFRTAPHMLLVSAADNAPTPVADGMIALSYFELLAQAHKLSTVWFGRFMMLLKQNAVPGMLKPFDIPKGYSPVYAMLFGESDIEFQRIDRREPVVCKHVTADDLNI